MNGIINVYKEKGYTSHDVVARLRGILHQRKIGHTGTLDPEAEGVLPVCVGNATKVCSLLTDKRKEYEAVMLLGVTTDTQDMTGHILSEIKDPIGNYTDEERITEIIKGFEGDLMQIPPMYSALKVNGKKLYELAREGKEIERKAREITIYRIDMIRVDLPGVRFKVECSKGTYIRTLCHDIGQKAGCGAAMETLVRTRVDCFDIERSLRLSEIEQLCDSGRYDDFLMPVDKLFEEYPLGKVRDEALKAVMNGNCLTSDRIILEESIDTTQGDPDRFTGGGHKRIRLYDNSGRFYGIYEPHPGHDGLYRPYRMFL